MNFLIFTECGGSRGFGHLTRCSALYEAIEERSNKVLMIINSSIEKHSLFNDKNIKIYDWINNFDFVNEITDSYVIIDSYNAGKDIYDTVSRHSLKCLFFDDDNRIDYPHGFILNPTNDASYGCDTHLFGRKYILVRKAFFEFRNRINQAAKNILIFLGADNSGLTEKILKTVQKEFPNLRIRLIAPSNERNSFIEKRMENDKVEFLCGLNSRQFANVMSEADIAVVAAGQTVLELSAVGTPFICIKTAENQQQNINWLLKDGIVLEAIDGASEMFESRLVKNIEKLLDFDVRFQMNKNMTDSIDSFGAERVYKELISERN